MISELKQARHLLDICGWSGPVNEPLSVDSAWRICFETFEGVARLSVQGALMKANAWPEGWRALQAVAAPAHAALDAFLPHDPPTAEDFRHLQRLCRLAGGETDLQECRITPGEPDLQDWLKQPQRSHEEVLRLFVLAIQRSKKAGRR